MSKLLTEVTGSYEPSHPFNQSVLDNMSAEQAKVHVEGLLAKARSQRDQYEIKMLASNGDNYKMYRHAWVIDSNNIVRFKEILDQLEEEG